MIFNGLQRPNKSGNFDTEFQNVERFGSGFSLIHIRQEIPFGKSIEICCYVAEGKIVFWLIFKFVGTLRKQGKIKWYFKFLLKGVDRAFTWIRIVENMLDRKLCLLRYSFKALMLIFLADCYVDITTGKAVILSFGFLFI